MDSNNTENAIQVFFETEAQILTGFITKITMQEERDVFEEISQLLYLPNLYSNKILTYMNTHCCIINKIEEKIYLDSEDNLNNWDLTDIAQIWLRDRKDESFQTVSPRKLFKSLGKS